MHSMSDAFFKPYGFIRLLNGKAFYPYEIPSKGLRFGVMVAGLVSSIYFPLRPNKRRSSCRPPRRLFSLDIQLLQLIILSDKCEKYYTINALVVVKL